MKTYYIYDPATKRLSAAPKYATIDGAAVINPTREQYATISAYPLADPMPPAPTPPEGKIAVPDGYELATTPNEAGPHWVRSYRYEDAPPPAPRTFSKLKLYAALAQAGLWDALVAWLNTQTFKGINAHTAFMLAQDLAEDNPLFDQWLTAAKTALGVTDEQAEAILAAAAE